jgi:abhydrolase domain-containing protein 14
MRNHFFSQNRIRKAGLRFGLLMSAGLFLVLQPASIAFAEASIRDASVMLQGHPVHYLAAGPEEGLAVMFLHGAKYHAGTWKNLGTLKKLGEAGFHALAIDIPGFGSSPRWETDKDTLVAELIDALELVRPVVVAPSKSGIFAFPLILNQPEKVSGFVSIAAIGTSIFTPQLKDVAVPILVVWGTRDRMFPSSAHSALAERFTQSTLLPLKNASHAAYLDKPELFHQGLLKFLGGLAATDDADGSEDSDNSEDSDDSDDSDDSEDSEDSEDSDDSKDSADSSD